MRPVAVLVVCGDAGSVATVMRALLQAGRRLIRRHWHACAHHDEFTLAIRWGPVWSMLNPLTGLLLCNRRRFCGLSGGNLIKCGSDRPRRKRHAESMIEWRV